MNGLGKWMILDQHYGSIQSGCLFVFSFAFSCRGAGVEIGRKLDLTRVGALPTV